MHGTQVCVVIPINRPKTKYTTRSAVMGADSGGTASQAVPAAGADHGEGVSVQILIVPLTKKSV